MKKKSHPGIVAIGISTGGPDALNIVLPQLPSNLDVPVLIVQHLPASFSSTLVQHLSHKCALKVKEGEHLEICEPNVIYFSPGGCHMEIRSVSSRAQIHLTHGPAVNHCKPSVDILFKSLYEHYLGRICAVIMTGMGHDGTQGIQLLKQKEAHIIAQNAQTCVVYGMPKEVIEMGLADVIAPLEKIAEEILHSVRGYK